MTADRICRASSEDVRLLGQQIVPAILATCTPCAINWDLCVPYESYEVMERQRAKEFLEMQLNGAKNGENFLGQWLRRENFIIVAIDGGAGSGKTTTARMLAERCNFAFVSTGEHYRILTQLFLRKNIAAGDRSALINLLSQLRPTTLFHGCYAHFSLDGNVITPEELRRQEINFSIPDYAAIPEVRAFLREYNRQLPFAVLSAGFRGMVIEGRDIGSAVFPEAQVRAYLFVDTKERVRRRALEGICDDVEGRDRRDEGQMRMAQDVWLIDGTNLSAEDVVQLLQARLKEESHESSPR
ncbi:MAG: (d)CMP kinase [Puniceicoccales bacterium]|nr:(d)CMP kinase [Puniceicoccales bacterium]